MRPTSFVIVACFASISTGQILPSTYLNPVFNQNISNIQSYSVATIQELLTRSDYPSGWVGQNGWTVIAQWDYEHNTRLFYEDVSQAEEAYAQAPGGCFAYWHQPLVDCYNDDAGWAALASLQAYQAYGDEIFYERAVGVWQFVTTHGLITQQDLDNGYLVGTKYRNNTLQSQCLGASIINGVYWQNGAPEDPSFYAASSNPYINSVSTDLYALLGAELCLLTGNMTYCDYAYNSIQWTDRFLLDSAGLPVNHIVGNNCSIQNNTSTYNAGLYLAAYAILGTITGNQTALDLATRTAISAMNTTHWNTEQGIIDEYQGPATEVFVGVGFKGILIRYLHRVYPLLGSEVAAAILQYINIQYYAITQLDSHNPDQPLLYGRNWTGPGFSAATGQSQVTALDVLNGITLNPPTAFPNSTAQNVPVIVQ